MSIVIEILVDDLVAVATILCHMLWYVLCLSMDVNYDLVHADSSIALLYRLHYELLL